MRAKTPATDKGIAGNGTPANGTEAQFTATHWSVVLTAARSGVPEAENALARLCEIYWYPLYAFVRRLGREPEDAKDLTQEFFLTRLLEKNSLRDISPHGGKFRSYLLTILKHFLSDDRERNAAIKRGGGKIILSFDAPAAETQYQLEPVDDVTPDRLYERRCALALLEKVRNDLRNAYIAEGNGDLFDRLIGCLTGAETLLPYSQLAAALGQSEASIKVAVHRLRRRFGQMLRAEVAEDIADPQAIDDEIRHLISISR